MPNGRPSSYFASEDQLSLAGLGDVVTRAVNTAFERKINEPKKSADPKRDLSAYPISMTTRQVAAALNCSFQHVLNLHETGELQAKNIGTKKQQCLRFARAHIAAYLANDQAQKL